jgi:hypothetical protein
MSRTVSAVGTRTPTTKESGVMEQTITIAPPRISKLTVVVQGTSPLITHAWSVKAKQMMLDKQMKKATKAKEAKNPEQDYLDSLYVMPEGQGYGFPSVGFKAAVVRAGTYADFHMTFLRGAFHVPGELVKIDGEPSPREDMVRLSGKVADIRYRAQFEDWSANIPVHLNESALSREQLANLFLIAGFAVGVGEWRPEKNGQYGRFEIMEVRG